MHVTSLEGRVHRSVFLTIYQAFRKYMLSVTVLLICNILKNS